MSECACVGGEGAHWQSAYEMLDWMKALDIGLETAMPLDPNLRRN